MGQYSDLGFYGVELFSSQREPKKASIINERAASGIQVFNPKGGYECFLFFIEFDGLGKSNICFHCD